MTVRSLAFAVISFVMAFHLSSIAQAKKKKMAPAVMPQYELEMTGTDYANLFSSEQALIQAYDGSKTADLQAIIDAGKRNLDWLKFINDHRDAQHKISLSSPATQAAFPMDQPRIYNPDLIAKTYSDLLAVLPESLKTIIQTGGSFPLNPPMEDADFITWSAKIDSSYQLASRWILLSPYISSLEERQAQDVRGYYFLSQDANLKTELANWASLSSDQQNVISEELTEMCMNNNGKNCAAEISQAVIKNSGLDIYTKYFDGSKKLYNSFFVVQVPRSDVKWDDIKNEMLVPFQEPTDSVVKSFLSDNIQDEWHWTKWQLLLNFQPAGPNTPEITFVAGATPHVNGLAGNTITMDANQPLTEYNVRWTIRHEFGHVLGFPDCYIEFYDAAKSVMISYQLDITNLMCSRRGHLQERHYTELKKAYGK